MQTNVQQAVEFASVQQATFLSSDSIEKKNNNAYMLFPTASHLHHPRIDVRAWRMSNLRRITMFQTLAVGIRMRTGVNGLRFTIYFSGYNL